MVMHLSAANVLLFYWLWRMPWASAQELALVLQATADPSCHMSVNAINRALSRHPEWVKGYRVGRKGNTVSSLCGSCPRGWWDLERGLRLAAPVVVCRGRPDPLLLSPPLPGALLQGPLPNMLQTQKSGMIVADLPAICPDGNGGVAGVDYTGAVLQDLVWYQDSVVRLVAAYRVEGAPFDLFLPVVYYGSYRRPSDVGSWEDEVKPGAPRRRVGRGSPTLGWI